MDPGWWPLSGFALGGIVNHPPARQRGGLVDRTIGELLMAWLPIVVTGIIVPIVGFLFAEFKDIKTWQARTDAEVAILKEHDAQLTAENAAQDRERKLQDAVVARRLDIHRAEIDTLRSRVDDHISRNHSR